jgi:hypothetical protein
MAYAIKWVGGNPIVTFDGVVSMFELIQANNEILGNYEKNSMKWQIFDFEMMICGGFTDEDMKIISTIDKVHTEDTENVRIALVSECTLIKEITDSFNFAMNDTSWVAKQFSNLNDAFDWCSIAMNEEYSVVSRARY